MSNQLKVKRKQISQPPDWWTAIEEVAQQNHVTVSQWIGKCCLHFVDKKKRRTLSIRPKVGKRPKRTDILSRDEALKA